MKAHCDKCGYDLDIDDKLLLEGTLEFSCPKCQNGIKLDKKEIEQLFEEAEINKTDIQSNHLTPDLQEDETIIQASDEHEITIDKIADEISHDETTSERKRPEKDSIEDLLPGPSQISKTFRETNQSDISMISSRKTEIDSTTGKRPLETPTNVKKKEAKETRVNVAKSSLSDLVQHHVEKPDRAFKTRKPFTRETVVAWIPIALIGLLFLAYPFYSLQKTSLKFDFWKTDPGLSELFKEVKDHSYIDTAESIKKAAQILLEMLGKNPNNTQVKAKLAKMYAYLGQKLYSEELLKTSMELALETLTLNSKEPDAFTALAIFYLDEPETSLKFLNRARNTRAQLTGKLDSKAEDLYIEACIEMRTGQFDNAMKKLDKALTINPDFAKAMRTLAKIHGLKGENATSKLMLTKAEDFEERYYVKYPDLKPKDNGIKKTPVPTPAPTKIATIAPTFKPTPARTPLRTPVRTRKPTPKPTQSRVASWDQKHREGIKLLASARYIEAEKELTEAANDYKKRFPKHTRSKTLSSIYTTLGNTYLKQFKTDDAMNIFHVAIKYNKANPQSHKGLAEVYEVIGESKQAIKHYKYYLHYNPNAGDKNRILYKIRQLKK